MTIDLSKYGTPIEDNKGFIGKEQLSKYGTPATPATPAVTPKGESGLRGFATGFAKGGLEGVKFLGQVGTYLGNKAGLGLPREYGSGSEFTKKLFSEENLKAKSGAEKLGKVAEFAAEVFVPGLSAKKGIQSARTLNYLKNTPETLTALEEKAASLVGRVKTTLGGSKTVLASETEKRAAQILNGKVSGSVTKNPQIIDKEIARRGQEVENFLTKNAKTVSAQEQADMFSRARATMEKYATKTELKAYDEQMRTFLKQIPGRGGYTTDNFYKALKEFEQNVTRNLPKGKQALLGDSQGIGSARIRAAQDIRRVVRDMIGQKHPEFKGKMFDLASLYDVLDTALTKSRQFDTTGIRKFFNSATKIGATGGATYLLGKKLLGGNSGQSFSDINTIGNQ